MNRAGGQSAPTTPTEVPLHDPNPRAGPANRLALIGILLLAACLRFYALDASSLWNDEGTTWAMMSRSFSQIADSAAADIHPPGYYWLLRIWSAVPGANAWSMRSLSAALGVLLVFVTYQIGTYLEPPRRSLRVTALLAALLAALNPFQVYYSQEARMYILLALASAGLYWALFSLVRREAQARPVGVPLAWYFVCGAAGLWTHYSFPIVLASAGLAYVVGLVRRPTKLSAAEVSRAGFNSEGLARPARTRRLVRFLIANLIVLLLYLPWLPTAIERVLNWPKGGDWKDLLDSLTLTLQTLVTGPIRTAPELSLLWLLVAALLPLIGIWALRSRFAGPALGLWWLSPIALMFALGLFSDAFLKFLLVASPAWCLLVAAAPLRCQRPRRILQAALAVVAVLLGIVVLPGYYADPLARDNYAGVARYLGLTGDPAEDIVIINAPGQQEVWSYYDPGLPALQLPEQRPPDPEQTVKLLDAALEDRRHAYAMLWATDESDPERIVEGWLDQNAFKGIDSWQGNMRFVVYTLPSSLNCRQIDPTVRFGSDISLQQQCQPSYPQQVTTGDAATVALHWQTETPQSVSYKVSVQLLDERNQVIAQHDGVPAGGSRLTPDWVEGETVVDNHGLSIPVGTPPGDYRLIVAMYDPATGERLPVQDTDHLQLGEVTVVRPDRSLPPELISIQHRTDKKMGPITLIGFAAHAKGQSHAPETPIRPGDLVHITLFWQAPDPLPADWPEDLEGTLRLGEQIVTAPLAGGAYPTGLWQPGEVVRGEFDIVYDGVENRLAVSVGAETYRLRTLPIE